MRTIFAQMALEMQRIQKECARQMPATSSEADRANPAISFYRAMACITRHAATPASEDPSQGSPADKETRRASGR